MAIEGESSGWPEVDLKRPTTKVNLGIVFAAAFFFVIMFVVVMRYAKQSSAGSASPPPPQNAPAANDPR